MNTNRPATPSSDNTAPRLLSSPSDVPSRLFSLGWLLVMIVLSLGVAGIMIPRKSELVKRLVADGRHDRALFLVGQGMESSGDPNSSDPSADHSPAALIRIILDSIDHDFDESSQDRIETLIGITEDPGGMHAALHERRRIIPSRLYPEWLDQLASRSVQTGKPKLAATIYSELADIRPPSVENARDWVAACRFAGQPGQALEVISRLLDSQQLPYSQLPEDLRELTIALHREVNQGTVAFDLLSTEFRNTEDSEKRLNLVEQLTTVAAQSGRISDSLPLVEAYLAETPAGKQDWKTIAQRSDSASFDPEFQRLAGDLARQLEWNRRPSDAFVLYRKLAVMGDIDALDRCVTIYPWIDRQGDVTDLLQVLVPVVGRDRYTLLLGRLLSECGQFGAAEEIYRAELAGKRAEDPETWAELAGILDAQERLEEARDAYLTALSLDPSRHPDRAQVARLQVSLGKHREALDTYREIPAEFHDRKTREDFAMLAKSLHATSDYLHVLNMKLADEPGQHTGIYLDIADAWESQGRPDEVEKALRRGLEALPESALLELRLVDFLAQARRSDEAFDHLAENLRPGDKRYAARLLTLGQQIDRISQTISLLSNESLQWSPVERLELAYLFEATGNLTAALEQFRLAEGGEVDTARIEAELAYAQGDLLGSIQKQERFLGLLQEPDHEAWTFLGDLYRAANRIAESENAYRTALEHLKRELAEESLQRQPEMVSNP